MEGWGRWSNIDRFVRRDIKIFTVADWENPDRRTKCRELSNSGINRCKIPPYRFFEKIKDLLFLSRTRSDAGPECKGEVERKMFRRCLGGSSRDLKPRLAFPRNGNVEKTLKQLRRYVANRPIARFVRHFHRDRSRIPREFSRNRDYFIPSSFSVSFVAHLDFLHSFLYLL